jgi:hypothetical protein
MKKKLCFPDPELCLNGLGNYDGVMWELSDPFETLFSYNLFIKYTVNPQLQLQLPQHQVHQVLLHRVHLLVRHLIPHHLVMEMCLNSILW